MQSNAKFIEKAREIAKRDKAVFDTLLEFEKTGKIRTKTKMTFTIDKTTASQFQQFCRKHGYNMSAKMEQAMKRIMEKE